MSLRQTTTRAVGKVVGLIFGYFILAGPYYTILDELYNIAATEADATLNTFIAWVYPTFYYGYPSVVVFGVIWTIVGLYREIRSRYYETEEVSYYGS